MRKTSFAILILLILACASITASAQSAKQPQINTESGVVAGIQVGKIERFLGIPYAAPPLGQLRWRAPQPEKPWQGTRQTTQYGSDCMQKPYPSDAAPLGTTPAEDCLTINVWRPANTKPTDHLPILFWIFGGGNVNGGASPDVYSGDAFARDGVMMVSFNWRVGRFGFFTFPELTRQNADHGLLSNYGFMDAIAALQWVQRNIAAFGGDPKQVTIYGQSAGAGQVYNLFTTPLAKGLFARAIIQSGGGAGSERTSIQASEKSSENFAKRWGIEGTDAAALDKLRALSADQIVDGIHIGTSAQQRSTFTGPVNDGTVVTETMLKALDAGREAHVPLLIGSTTADNYVLPAKTLDEALTTTFASVSGRASTAYKVDQSSADPEYVLRQMARDIRYNEPDRYIATTMRAQGLPVYVYRFGYVANTMRQEWSEGPPHATDIPYSMETVKAKYGDKVTPTDEQVSKMLHTYWVNFVRSGDPNGPGLPKWPVYERKDDVLLQVHPDGSAAAAPDPRKTQIDVVAVINGHK